MKKLEVFDPAMCCPTGVCGVDVDPALAQFAADLKANGDDEATSRGLGHISAETRRVYGTASQASKRYRLRPLRIEVERPVKPRSRGPCTKWRNEPA